MPCLEDSTSSSSTLEKVRNWYLSCRTSHQRCKVLKSPIPWCPSRLLDIGDHDQTEWRLYLTSEGQDPPPAYITLSYRWGSNNDFKLTQANLSTGFKGQIEDLPQTFKDAIVVARLLSVRFLWIDRLCITQDSKADWDIESVTMRDVYANSLCNIAASASTDPDGGLFRSRVPSRVQPGVLTASFATPETTSYYVFNENYVDRQVSSGPLQSRGWVFQERMLAPRTIHFAKDQVFWECFDEFKCESVPEGVLPGSVCKRDVACQLGLSQDDASRSAPDSSETNSLWGGLMEQYTKCSFTKETDRLVAFCGIARLFQNVTGDRYAAGLWRSDLIDQLAWWVQHPVARSCTHYCAPTWSWASVSGPVCKEWGSFQPPQAHIEVLDVQVQTSPPNTLGSVLSGHITLRCPLLKATCNSTEDAEAYLLTIGPQHTKHRMLPDALGTNLEQDCVLAALPLRRVAYLSYEVSEESETLAKEVPKTQFLVLEPLINVMSVYKRIGLLEIDVSDWLERSGIEMTEKGLAVYNNGEQLPEITVV